MFDLELGDPHGAQVFLGVMTAIGLLLGAVIFIVVAFPWARRPRFRNFDAMPRTGAVCGLGVAIFFAYIAWRTASADFHRIEIREDMVRLYYLSPEDPTEIPLDAITGVRCDITMAKWDRWRILLETDAGDYSSANVTRPQMDAAWSRLGDFVKPLP